MNYGIRHITLGEAATFINGRAFKPKEWSTKGLPIIRIQNLTKTSNDYNYYTGEYDKKHLVKRGDILISWSASLGVYEWDEQEGLLNQHIYKVDFNKESLDKKYFKYITSKVIDDMLKYVHGSTMKHITKGDFDSIQIPLPPLDIQKKIAAVLDKADELRRKRQEALDKLDQLAQSVFLDMFGDPVTNPKGWEVKPIGQVTDSIVPGRDKPKTFTGDIPWITTDELLEKQRTYKSSKGYGLTLSEVQEVRARIIPSESVLMTCVGDLGITSIAGKDMVINQQLHSYQCSADITNIYLMFALPFQKKYMYSRATKTTLPYMNKTTCNTIPIPVPPIKVQNEFSLIIDEINKKYRIIHGSIKYYDDLFNSLINRSFMDNINYNDKTIEGTL